MGLIDTIRKTEERSRDAARRGLQMAKAGWEDTERALRRRMRIYPNSQPKSKSTQDAGPSPADDVALADDVVHGDDAVHEPFTRPDDQGASERGKRPAIVSVNGKDMGREQRSSQGKVA